MTLSTGGFWGTVRPFLGVCIDTIVRGVHCKYRQGCALTLSTGTNAHPCREFECTPLSKSVELWSDPVGARQRRALNPKPWTLADCEWRAAAAGLKPLRLPRAAKASTVLSTRGEKISGIYVIVTDAQLSFQTLHVREPHEAGSMERCLSTASRWRVGIPIFTSTPRRSRGSKHGWPLPSYYTSWRPIVYTCAASSPSTRAPGPSSPPAAASSPTQTAQHGAWWQIAVVWSRRALAAVPTRLWNIPSPLVCQTKTCQ